MRSDCANAIRRQQNVIAVTIAVYVDLVSERKWTRLCRLLWSYSKEKDIVKRRYGDYEATIKAVKDSLEYTLEADQLLYYMLQ